MQINISGEKKTKKPSLLVPLPAAVFFAFFRVFMHVRTCTFIRHPLAYLGPPAEHKTLVFILFMSTLIYTHFAQQCGRNPLA